MTLRFSSASMALAAAISAAGVQAETVKKPILLDQATMVLFRADMKLADARCLPAGVSILPGDAEARLKCSTAEERAVWARYSPATIDLFDIQASQFLYNARRFDSRDLSVAEFRTILTGARSQLSASIKQRMEAEFATRVRTQSNQSQ
jgi:hypothetical protein